MLGWHRTVKGFKVLVFVSLYLYGMSEWQGASLCKRLKATKVGAEQLSAITADGLEWQGQRVGRSSAFKSHRLLQSLQRCITMSYLTEYTVTDGLVQWFLHCSSPQHRTIVTCYNSGAFNFNVSTGGPPPQQLFIYNMDCDSRNTPPAAPRQEDPTGQASTVDATSTCSSWYFPLHFSHCQPVQHHAHLGVSLPQ
jgi:hypothetical protein